MISLFLFILGFISIGFQTLLLREFLVIFSNNELIIGIFLFNWMLVVGVACYIGEIFIKRIRDIKKIFKYLVFATIFIIPTNIFLIGFLRKFFQKIPSEMLGLISAFSFSFFSVFLVCLIFGLWFVYCVNIFSSNEKNVALPTGKLYAIEVMGCVFGGFLTNILLIRYFSSFQISLIFSALIFILFSIYLAETKYPADCCENSGNKEKENLPLFHETRQDDNSKFPDNFAAPRRETGEIKTLAFHILMRYGLFLILFATLFYNSNKLEKFLISYHWKPFNVVETRDSVYGKIIVLKDKEAIDFYENSNKIYSTVLSTKNEEIVHIPMLLSDGCKNVLLLGGGLNDIKEILKYPVDTLLKVVYVEQNSVLVELLKKYADDSTKILLKDPRVKIVSTDGRFFVKGITDKYDCVILDASPPLSGVANRYFTKEFFLEIRNILSEEGVFVFPVLSSENYMSDEQRYLTTSIFKTVKSVFSYCESIPASNNYLISSSKKYDINSEIIKRKIVEKNIKTKYLTPFYIDYIFRKDRLEKLEECVKEKQEEVLCNTDFRPISYFYGLKMWLSFFDRKIFSKLEAYFTTNIVFASVISLYFFVILFFVKIKRKNCELIVVVISFTSTALMLAIIFAFQSVYGYIYQKIGILISTNLLGISVGSFLSEKFFSKNCNNAVVVKLTIIFMTIFSLILAFVSINKLFLSSYFFYFFIFIAGFFLGFVFPLVVTENRIGKFYALDLFGALVGSILVSLIFIPLFGIIITCFFVALCLAITSICVEI
ncbi:MAG: hypothetical protein ABID79_01775 [Elusimicrobiota bacterium]